MILPIEGDETAGWKAGTPAPFLNSEFHEQASQAMRSCHGNRSVGPPRNVSSRPAAHVVSISILMAIEF